MNLKSLAAPLLLLAFASAHATPLTWTLSGVSFVDGATASGSFVFDAGTRTYLSWDIVTTATVDPGANGGLSNSMNGKSYSTNSLSDASSGYFRNPSALAIQDALGNRFGFVYSSSLTDAGGVVPLKPGATMGYEINGFRSRNITAGSVMATSAVPEPATYALMLAGLCAISWARRRHACQACPFHRETSIEPKSRAKAASQLGGPSQPNTATTW